MTYPSLPLDFLDDGLIESGDYPDWSYAFHRIKTREYDRTILDELLESIPEDGLEEPLWIEVINGTCRLSLRDGHHRAVALDMLGIRRFPYRWSWSSPKGLDRPRPRDPLPAHVLESLNRKASL